VLKAKKKNRNTKQENAVKNTFGTTS